MQSAKKPFTTIRVKGCRVWDVTALRQMSHLGYDFVGIHAINSLDGRLLAPARRLVEIIADEDLTIEPVLLTKVPIVTQVVRGVSADGVRTKADGAGGRVVGEAPVLTGDVAQCLAGLDAILLRTAPFSLRPLIKMHERVAHLLDARQRVLEMQSCPGKRVTHGRIDAERFQGDLLEPFCVEELPQGEDELPRVDLPGTEP